MTNLSSNKTYNYIRITVFFVIAYIVLILWAAFSPSGLNWGFHFLAFYNKEILICLPLIMILLVLSAPRETLINSCSLLTKWFIKQHRVIQGIITISFLSGIVLLLWLFRVKIFFLGDGPLILRDMQSYDSGDNLALEYEREPLIGFCIVVLTNIFTFLKRLNPTLDAYIWLSILSGVIFIIAAYKTAKQFADEKIEQYLLSFLLITTGVSQLFFGYVENYSPSAACVLLFILFGVVYLKGNISITWIILVYGIAFIFHFGVIILFPAFALLIYISVKRKQIREVALSIFLVAVIVFSLLQFSEYPIKLLANILGGTGRHIVPFSMPLNSYQAYKLFSLSHVVDVVNFLLLCYPAILILLAISMIMIRRGNRTFTIETKFILLAALCSIMFVIILNCEIGMSRDWDILAPISLGIPAAAIALWSTIECEKELKHHILIMLCAVSLLHTGLWVGVNANENRAGERFKMIIDDHLWSKHAHLNAYEELAIYYRERSDYEKAIDYYQKYIYLDSTNQRIFLKLANVYQLAGNKKIFIELYKKMIQMGMENSRVLTILGNNLANEKRYSEALDYFKRAEEHEPQNPKIKLHIGETIIRNEQAFKKAIPYFIKAIQIDSSYAPAYYKAAQCYLMLGDSSKANQIIRQLYKYASK